jgi:hypothetical protein
MLGLVAAARATAIYDAFYTNDRLIGSGNLTIGRSVFFRCIADDGGAVIWRVSGTYVRVSVTESVFVLCSATGNNPGGAIHFYPSATAAELSILRSCIEECAAYYGGAVYASCSDASSSLRMSMETSQLRLNGAGRAATTTSSGILHLYQASQSCIAYTPYLCVLFAYTQSTRN